MPKVMIKSKVKQHTRRMASGKVVEVKEHEVNGIQGIHHKDIKRQSREAKAKSPEAHRKFHQKRSEIHATEELRLNMKARKLKGKAFHDHHAAANWHGSQSMAHDYHGIKAGEYEGKTVDRKNRSWYTNEAKAGHKEHVGYSKKNNPKKSTTDTLDMLKAQTAADAETLEKSQVKAHKRRMKSGKVVDVKEHMVNGMKGYHHPDTKAMPGHLKEDERAGFHEKMAAVHSKHYAQQTSASVKAEKDGKKNDVSHQHEAAASWHMDQHLAHASEAKKLKGEGKENYFAAGAAQGYDHHLKKVKGRGPEKSLDDFPLLKAVMAKSLKFKKSGKDLKEKLKQKIDGLHLELAEETGRFREEVRQASMNREKSTDYKDGETRVPTNAEIKPLGDEEPRSESAPMPDYPAESWKMQSLQRQIGQCFTIERNLNDRDSYELSEYDLKQYGF